MRPKANEMILKELKRIRKEKKISLADLSGALKISRSTLIDIENGIGNPSFNKVSEVIEYLGFELKLQLKG